MTVEVYTGGHNYVRVIIMSFNFLLSVMVLSLGVWFNCFKIFMKLNRSQREYFEKRYSKFWLQHFKNKFQ